MVHISQLSEARVERVEDVVRQGDEVTVRVREIDSRGRINLTLRGRCSKWWNVLSRTNSNSCSSS